LIQQSELFETDSPGTRTRPHVKDRGVVLTTESNRSPFLSGIEFIDGFDHLRQWGGGNRVILAKQCDGSLCARATIELPLAQPDAGNGEGKSEA
jgi:hypothetical protein